MTPTPITNYKLLLDDLNLTWSIVQDTVNKLTKVPHNTKISTSYEAAQLIVNQLYQFKPQHNHIVDAFKFKLFVDPKTGKQLTGSKVDVWLDFPVQDQFKELFKYPVGLYFITTPIEVENIYAWVVKYYLDYVQDVQYLSATDSPSIYIKISKPMGSFALAGKSYFPFAINGKQSHHKVTDNVRKHDLMQQHVDCPVQDIYWCVKNTLDIQIQHLNDDHKWTREQIADWLDTLEEQPIYYPDIKSDDEKIDEGLKSKDTAFCGCVFDNNNVIKCGKCGGTDGHTCVEFNKCPNAEPKYYGNPGYNHGGS